jgi:phosphoribosyl-ATP pyrophosphohydrolase/phosphoribosyl-AMP cyclohydrolase/histidinol dehydrogenase
LRERAPSDSYTRRLLEDPSLLANKIQEEARELVEAGSRRELIHEAADLFYFALVRLVAAGIELTEIETELDRRARRVRRRGGDPKTSLRSEESR